MNGAVSTDTLMNFVKCPKCDRTFGSSKALNAHSGIHRADYVAKRSVKLMLNMRKSISRFLREPAVIKGETVPEDVISALSVAKHLLETELDARSNFQR